eukprot:GHUV01013694.1.p3 GENE.GHUV01013694.1~~GHUV01013694.1.p3  ORF type:complete len:108 (+),score=8.30 GHUV01013694.1:2751-3074(+)
MIWLVVAGAYAEVYRCCIIGVPTAVILTPVCTAQTPAAAGHCGCVDTADLDIDISQGCLDIAGIAVALHCLGWMRRSSLDRCTASIRVRQYIRLLGTAFHAQFDGST